MKKVCQIALIILTMGCQKELSLDLNSQPGLKIQSGLLEKMEWVSMPQNQVYLTYQFSYDDSGRVSRIVTNYAYPSGNNLITASGISDLVRDQLGRTIVINYTPDTVAAKAVFTYQGSTRKLNHVILIRNQTQGSAVLDSLVYTYQQETLSRTDQFNRQPNGQFRKTGYQEYSWDTNGNLLSKRTYQDDDGNGLFEPSIRYSWTYDSNPNPVPHTDPAMAYWSFLWPTCMSVNNVTKQMNYYPPNGGPDDELNYTYQYDTNKKPIAQTQTPYGTIARFTYYK